MSRLQFREDDLIDNPSARIPVALCLDASPSMSDNPLLKRRGTTGVPIEELNRGVRQFYDSIREDAIASNAVDLAIVTYSHCPVVLRDFGSITNAEAPPQVECEMKVGGTHIGKAMLKCLEILEARKDGYRKAGVEYYQPWVVLMTDGGATDKSHEVAAPKIRELVESNKLTVLPLAIGEGADRDVLQLMSPRIPVLTLKDLKFSEYFEWLSMSIQSAARQSPEDSFEIDMSPLQSITEYTKKRES